MPVFEARTMISAEPEIVWDILTDGGNLTVWNSGISAVAGQIHDGAKIRIRTGGERQRDIWLRIRQSQPHTMQWRGSAYLGLLRETFTVALTEEPTGTILLARHELRGLVLLVRLQRPLRSTADMQVFVDAVRYRAELLARHARALATRLGGQGASERESAGTRS
ncbi:SRPBCC family protein [Paenarthrobacter sp. NCHU4564]|uniref:SRPBCC family protein n=1 Tax=Paenarthrobacter sp. NCHU4564 TaxID=3451353 RepID=UPI003F994429